MQATASLKTFGGIFGSKFKMALFLVGNVYLYNLGFAVIQSIWAFVKANSDYVVVLMRPLADSCCIAALGNFSFSSQAN